MRVLLADDQALLRAGFRKLLDGERDIDVTGEAADGVEAVELARRLRPDVVLMDIRMPRLDGIAATRRLADEVPRTRVLILTTYDLDEYVFEALRAGASGFLLKDSDPDQLVAAIRLINDGEALLSPSVTRRLIQEFARRPPRRHGNPPELAALTARELDVIRLLARGRSNAEIAEHLVLGEATIKTHVSRILSKLGLRDRVQAVVLAYDCGLVEPDSGQPHT
jgi:DNA-binding NarL/FixJ family response regulator